MSKSILKHNVWDPTRDSRHEATQTNIPLHYQRAKVLCLESGLSVDDILHLTPKFWRFHTSMLCARDPAAFTIATIHLNLCIGTVARFLDSQPDLHDLLADLLKFKICGEFMLTEIGHGLDARNLETTATMLEDRSFVLNTPTWSAAKAMPPTTPLAGVPRRAVVFARLIVQGEDRGVKPFLVPINGAEGQMHPGVTSRVLPLRPGTKPLDHAITTFNHVRLAPGDLLGTISQVQDERTAFLDHIWRVAVGSLALSMASIPALKVAGCIAALYSQRRHVATGGLTQTMPIIKFSTQSRPVLKALAHAEVLDAFARWAVQEFMNPEHNVHVQRGIATAFKALVVRSLRMLPELAERCGWQGLFTHNQINELALSFQGNSIAEGDTLVLCIRLASEILLGKYRLPEPIDHDSHLARYEKGLFDESTNKMSSLSDGHRGEGFNAGILPQCRTMVEAIGQRMAFEVAISSESMDSRVLDVFLVSCIREDLSWYVEHGLFSRTQLWQEEEKAFGRLYDLLPELVERTGAKEYITAPMIKEMDLHEFILSLPSFGQSRL